MNERENGGAMRPESWLERHWKILRELTALIGLMLFSGFLLWHYINDARPGLAVIQRFAVHEAAFAALPQIAQELAEHRKWELENYRVAVLQCRAARAVAKQDPDLCGAERTMPR